MPASASASASASAFAFAFASAFASPASACEPRAAPLLPASALSAHPPTPTPFDRLGCNLVDTVAGENLLLYGAALLSTVELSATLADHDVRVALETYAQSRPFSEAMVTAGYLGPPAVGVLLYAAGLVRRDHDVASAGAAAIQAMAITFAATVLLKVATDRPFPNHGGDPRSPDRLEHPEWSREWNGPRLGNSAWPSGHMSVAMSLASSLTAYWIDSPWAGLIAYPAAGAIGFGVLSGADHWLSDVVAGALLGQAVGWSIGTDFRRMHHASNSSAAAASGARTAAPMEVRVVPLPGARGLAVVGSF